MQRLFTMFPRGLPGFALALLRVSVALALLLACCAYKQGLSVVAQVIAIVLSAALCLGYLTPLAAIAGLVLHAFVWFGAGTGSAAVAAIVILDAVALALLGPGAYSIDSYRYGRRIVVLTAP